MEQLIGQQMLYDGVGLPLSEAGRIGDLTSPLIYEVIRVKEGVPLYLEDHLERFVQSLDKMGIAFEGTFDRLKQQSRQLIQLNDLEGGNLKWLYGADKKGMWRLAMYYYAVDFPTREQTKEGIDATFVKMERHNPNIKVWKEDYKKFMADTLAERSAYEAIIVNDEGYATEGGKSNFFVVYGDTLYTSPGKTVLKGITRQMVMKVLETKGIPLVERLFTTEEILTCDGCFFTGTGIDVLPIKTIDGVNIPSGTNALVQSVVRGFEAQEQAYIERNRL